jgi:hypothetical protein
MTLKKEGILEAETSSARLPFLKNLFWKRLGTCCNADYRMKVKAGIGLIWLSKETRDRPFSIRQ